ncbi:MAG: 50S ribosomal protein L29 [candidate division Zixibacteria bacterium RBG_16_43_9]|jgi:large subunit ribosomal protein L29|nr:MAG: 50S ribosomal protein L29 [candidate division Zixibacteria bacterium RBG_16_43_9]
MKKAALKDLTKEELIQKRDEIEEELFNLRMQESAKKLDNPLRLRVIRREIARINTMLHEEELGKRKLATPEERKIK